MANPRPELRPTLALAAELDERSRRVLAAVVREHLDEGDPVGSTAVARRSELEVSAATVRSVMADLEALGFLEKPHTSAGRIPTAQGYRYYVDTLLRLQAPRADEQKLIEQRAQAATQGQGVEGLLTEATRVLHAMTHHAGVVALPRLQGERLQRIELVALREGRVLAVLVTQSGAVQNRLLQTPPGEPPLSPAQLAQAQGWLNTLLGNLTLVEARDLLSQQLATDRALLEETRVRALALGAQAVELAEEPSALRVEGHSSLLDEPAWLSDATKVRTLLRALEEKQGILALLERVQVAHGLVIFIGKESGLLGDDLAVVAAPYYSAGQVVGALGVLGPTRMDYARVIPLVEFTARTVGLALGAEP